MNDFLSQVFDTTTDARDVDLVAAGETLAKIAAEENIDLNSLDDATVEGLLKEVITAQAGGGGEATTETPAAEPEKTAAATPAAPAPAAAPAATKTASQEPDLADVSVELLKIASAEGVDLSKISKDEYTKAFDKLAGAMASGEYFKKQAEAEEMQAKLAEMDVLGRGMAHSFMDEVQKIAAKDKPAETKTAEEKTAESKKLAEMPEKLRAAIEKKMGKGGEGKDEHEDKHEDKKEKEHEEKKASLEAAATAMARRELILNGINPDGGEKFASDEDATKALAIEMLRAGGYIK